MRVSWICLDIMDLPMLAIHARRARLPEGWATDVRVTLDGLRIALVTPGVAPDPGDLCIDTLLPALSNLHSHSFQRALAGRTERRAAGRESFWTWRETMYAFVARLTPEQVEAIAALTFCEMQEAGFAAVGEFHYLHHAPGGAAYDRPAELSHRIFAAAAETGIGLTHLPVLYRYGGAGRQPLAEGQRRFGCDPGRFAALLEDARAGARGLPDDTVVGIAPHSLRAVTPEDLDAILPLAEGGPVHMHVAEQPREVAEVQAWLGARPVEWLLGNAPVDGRWCAIHATHMTPGETAALARSGAVAGLCPITEANLGDGPFGGPAWLAAGGAFGVGADSNVGMATGEGLRPPEDSLLAGDGDHPALAGLWGDAVLDGLVFAAGGGGVTDLWSAGRHSVREGRHVARDAIRARYCTAIAALTA